MTKLRVALADDEPYGRERLRRLLEECGCEVVAEFCDGPSIVAWLEEKPEVDALFLDIQMPGATGLEVQADLESPPPVVFITAHPEHAIRAFESEAVDYLLKPVYKDRLERTLDRIRRQQGRGGGPMEPVKPAAANRFPVKAGTGGHVFLELRHVSYFEVEDEVVWAWVGDKHFRTPWTCLSDVEAAFPGVDLIRIQRHQLIRAGAVLGVRSIGGGRVKVRVGEKVELEVSRGMTPKLRAMLGIA